jgi:hypothetical protein
MATEDNEEPVDTGQAPRGATGEQPYSSYGQYISARLGGPSAFGYLNYYPASADQPERIEFVSKKYERYFNLPVAQIHSLSLADYNTTLEFWDNDLRHRVCLLPKGLAQANLMAEFTGDTDAKHWQAFLAPKVGQAPEGVTVKPPMSKGKRVALNYTLGCSIALIVIIVVVVITIIAGSG